MFDHADAGHEEDYPLREGEGEKCAGLVGSLARDRYDEAESIQPIGGEAAAEDTICENGAQDAGADEDGGAERGGFLGSANVIVGFWGHLDGLGFFLAVHRKLLWDLRCILNVYTYVVFLGVQVGA